MIDVIVVNLNRSKETIQTINALFKANDNIRVILINNGSIDRPCIESTNRITVIDLKKNLGQAKAVNIGLRKVKTKYVCFMHNDIFIYDKNWINKAVKFLKKNKKAGLVDVYGWKMIDGKLHNITSMRGHNKVTRPSHDFEEVSRTDEMANIFKNDGLRADERYLRPCCGVWVDILGRGQKLYVIRLEDAEHSLTNEINEGKGIAENRRDVRLLKLKEWGITDPVAHHDPWNPKNKIIRSWE